MVAADGGGGNGGTEGGARTGGADAAPVRRAPRRRRWGRVASAAGAALLLAFLLTPTGCYISRAAYAEARILAARRPIPEAAADTTLPAAIRAKLALVSEARRFALDSLGLRAQGEFTQVSFLDRDTLVLVLSASYRDRLERRTWWFPVVGRFPYKGYFDFDAAHAQAEAMRRDGFDVRLGASSAFSTLGWFDDPVTSPTLRLDSVSLVNTVLHELLHTTYFAKGDVTFNESFASFVGARGAIAFFRARGDTVNAARAERAWAEERVLGAFWERLYVRLDSAFAAHPDTGTDVERAAATFRRLSARERVFGEARRVLRYSVGPALGREAGWAERVVLDNAVVMARRVYATGLGGFEGVFRACGSVRGAVAFVVGRVGGGGDRFAVLAEGGGCEGGAATGR